MKNPLLSMGEVLTRERLVALLNEADRDRIAAQLRAWDETKRDPVIVKILSGIGAWFAALFLGFFLGAARLLETPTGLLFAGTVLLVSALAISRTMGKAGSVFLEQIALAFLLCGDGLVVAGVAWASQRGGQHMSTDSTMALLSITQTILGTLIYLLDRGSVGRFLILLAVPVFWSLWAWNWDWFDGQRNHPWALHLIVSAEAALFALLFLRPRAGFLDVLAYAAAVTLPANMILLELLFSAPFHLHVPKFAMWPTATVMTAVLAAAIFVTAREHKTLHRPGTWLALIGVVLLGAFTTPGILVAILLLIVGYAQDDRWLTAIGYLFLAVFVFAFYYSVDISLAQKSWVIAGSGLLLLVLRWLAGVLAERGNRA